MNNIHWIIQGWYRLKWRFVVDIVKKQALCELEWNLLSNQAKFGDNNCEFQISQSPLKICEISEICGGLFQPMYLERFLHFYTEVKQIPVSVGTVFLQRRYRLHSSTFMSSKCTLELWETIIAPYALWPEITHFGTNNLKCLLEYNMWTDSTLQPSWALNVPWICEKIE